MSEKIIQGTASTEIQQVEETLKDLLHRIDVIERRLKTKLITTYENRERLETELEEAKEVLKKNEEKLKSLKTNNNTTFFMIATCMSFLCFLIFGLYTMFFKNL